jgi:subfamily B ATP-binding cassette protein HlyB/CyaB
MRLPLDYFETRSAGVTVARMRELETIRGFITGQGIFSLIDLIFVFVFVAVLFLYSSFLALITLCMIPLYVLIAGFVRPVFRSKLTEKFRRWAATQAFLVEAIVGMPTLKATAVEPHMQRQWEERLAAYVSTSFEATLLGSIGQNTIEFVSQLSTALILFFGAQEVIEGRLSIGALIAFNMIANQVSGPILRISQLWQDFQQIQISVERLGDILNSPRERVPHSFSPLPPPNGTIEIRNVSFRYRPELSDALKSVSLLIRPGELVGVVGASGSGKSTLTKLLQRLYLPTSGQILLDGTDLALIDPAWLRHQLGVVPQENLLFNRTIHENIALARPDMPRKKVVSIAKLSGADEFISRLPMGYDTQIEERGINLSGGQRQRIAIARALATNPRILIFDEATSSLDYESERIIQENMREIVKGRTVIVIAHRLAAVRNCDKIVAMCNGEIVEEGRHEDLFQRPNGVYARLWELQTLQVRGDA